MREMDRAIDKSIAIFFEDICRKHRYTIEEFFDLDVRTFEGDNKLNVVITDEEKEVGSFTITFNLKEEK